MINSKTTVTSIIDWLSVTGEKIHHSEGFTSLHTEISRGRLNYDTGIEYVDGRVELWHSSRPDMKRHLIVSGDTIRNLCSNYGIEDLDIVRMYSQSRASRLDLAVDIIGGTLDISGMAAHFHAGNVDTRATCGTHVRGVGDGSGETLYIGSAKAQRRLRVYDKAAEQGVNGDWTRIELQLRHAFADSAKSRLSVGGSRHLIPSMINDFASWQIPEWAIVMGTEKVQMTPIDSGKKSNRARWILDTCAKAIAKEVLDSGSNSIIGRLLDQVSIEVDVKESKVVSL